MEKSKVVGKIVARLKIAYPYYFEKMTNEDLVTLSVMYTEELKNYSDLTIENSIKEIIRNSKYMPALSEILEECEKQKHLNQNAIVQKMIEDNYFKDSSEIAKTYHFIETGCIPSWLLEDMKKYWYQDVKKIENQNHRLLN